MIISKLPLDLAERLREFEDVEVGGMAINGMD